MRVRLLTAWVLLPLIGVIQSLGRSVQRSSNETLYLRASAYHQPPLMMVQRIDNGNDFTLSGLIYDVLSVFEDKLNIRFNYVLADPTQVGNHGIPLATIHQLLKEEVDIAPYTFVRSHERSKLIEVSTPLLYQDYILLMPRPQEKSRLFILIRPFTETVWLVFISSIFVLTAIAAIFIHMKRSVFRQNSFIGNISRAADAIILRAGINYYNHRFLSEFTLFGTWSLMAAVLSYSYMTNMISHLTVPLLEPIPNSFEDLAKGSESKLVLESGYVITQTIMNSSSGPMKILGDSLRKNPDQVVKTTAEAIAAVSGQGKIYAGSDGFVFYIVGEDFKRNHGQCRFTVSEHLGFQQSFGFGLPLNGPYNHMFNQELQNMFETNILHQIYKKYDRDIEQCIIKKKRRAQPRILRLADLSGCFTFLGIGVATSLCVFLLERVIGTRLGQRRRNLHSRST